MKQLAWLHWLLGLSLGLVLSVMGITGAILSFDDEIMAAISPQSHVSAAGDVPLPPEVLVTMIASRMPDRRLVALQMEGAPDKAYLASFAARHGQGERNLRRYLDPYRGSLLDAPVGADFFNAVRGLHRYLSPAGENAIGRHLTAISALTLVFFSLSGLVLRWSGCRGNWRRWLWPDVSLQGRRFWRSLHGVVGTWLTPIYLLCVFSGLWWSYDGYRQWLSHSLSGQPAQTANRQRTLPDALPNAVNKGPVNRATTPAGVTRSLPASPATGPEPIRLMPRLAHDYPDGFKQAILYLAAQGKPRLRVVPINAAQPRAADEYQLQPDGHWQQVKRWASLPPGQQIIASIDPLHTGQYFGLPGRILFLLASAILPCFMITGLLMFLQRRRVQV